jgi:hypothetical protein
MRALAFRHASGTAVAVIEDHVIVPAGWARQMLDEIGRGAQVVGGPIVNAATGTLLDRAAFFCEYSHCIPPLPEGPSTWLPGNNVAYRRDVLERFRSATESGRWENYLHDRLREDGIELICRPEILVAHKKHYTFMEYLTQRWLYARSYAGARVAGAPLSRRFYYGLASVGLPPLLLFRIVSRLASKGCGARQVAPSLPLIFVFLMSWACGEFVGYWAGPGRALERVR